MSTRAIATLVLKVAALYCIIQSIPMFGAAVSSWFALRLDPLGPQATAYWGAALGGLVSCTMLIALAYLFFFRGEQLVPMLIEPEGNTKEGKISKWHILVLKVAALYCIIQSIPRIGGAVSSWFALLLRSPGSPQATAYWGAALESLVSCVLLIALAGLFLFRGEQLVPFPPDLDKDEVPIEPKASTKEGRISSSDIQAIIFSGVGLLILSLSVPGLGGSVTKVIYARIFYQPHFFNTWEIALLVQSLIQCGIGLALFLRARGLALFWHRIRKAGLPPAD